MATATTMAAKGPMSATKLLLCATPEAIEASSTARAAIWQGPQHNTQPQRLHNIKLPAGLDNKNQQHPHLCEQPCRQPSYAWQSRVAAVSHQPAGPYADTPAPACAMQCLQPQPHLHHEYTATLQQPKHTTTHVFVALVQCRTCWSPCTGPAPSQLLLCQRPLPAPVSVESPPPAVQTARL